MGYVGYVGQFLDPELDHHVIDVGGGIDSETLVAHNLNDYHRRCTTPWVLKLDSQRATYLSSCSPNFDPLSENMPELCNKRFDRITRS